METNLNKFKKLYENKTVHNDNLKNTISQIYDELNMLIYSGECIKLPITIKKNKRAAAAVIHSYNKIDKRYYPTELIVSDYWELDYNTWKGIIAHELIHVWIGQNNIKDTNAHGYRFMDILDKQNIKFPDLKIPRFHEGDKHPLAKHYSDSLKKLDYIVYTTNKNEQKWCTVAKEGFFYSNKEKLINSIKSFSYINKIWLGSIIDEQLEKLPKTTKINGFKGYGISDEIVNNLINNAEYIFDKKIDTDFKPINETLNYKDFLRLPKNVEVSDKELSLLKDIKWQDIKFDDLGSDTNIAKLNIVFPFNTNVSDGIIVDIQVITVDGLDLYQPHINMCDSLQNIGLGYKIIQALINDLGHIYSGTGRVHNPTVINKIFNKLKNDNQFITLTNKNSTLSMIKNHPNKDEYIDYMLSLNI